MKQKTLIIVKKFLKLAKGYLSSLKHIIKKDKDTTITNVLSIIAAIILLQTLYFKFTAHPDSVYVFTLLGLEPYGRVGLGIIELITAGMLIYPKTTTYGSIIGVVILSGAIASHLTVLGIVVRDDHGILFVLALIAFICCVAILWIKRQEVLNIIAILLNKK
ncbi:DoxX family protein [Leptobacterium sp. I13]|uniref:DoxX family protein n=1 Tax=Leptobacterium meishanense TaxID=3128904 RepID=UPI0030EC56BA